MRKTQKVILFKYEVLKDGLGCIYVKEHGEYKYSEFFKTIGVRIMGGFPSVYRITRKQRKKFLRHIAAGNSIYLMGDYSYLKENNKYNRNEG